MVLTVHHLGISQSERIVWLCEELGIPYDLKIHTRDPILAPESLKSLPGNNLGKAPFIEDDDVKLSESGAICEYIISKYGGEKGRALAPQYGDKNYVDYIHWFHYANATLQSSMGNGMFITQLAGLPEGAPVRNMSQARLDGVLKYIDDRLGKSKFLAGDQLTVADIMTVYCLTTQRYFGPQQSLASFTNIVRYLKDVGNLPGYQRAMEKGDPQMRPLLGAEPSDVTMFHQGLGTKGDCWKKSAL